MEVRKGGNGGKRPPEDKIDVEDHPSEGEEDDSSLETSLELNLDPQQLASVGLDRPLLRLRLMPRKKEQLQLLLVGVEHHHQWEEEL